MALAPGSIAFTGFNADSNDSLAFVALVAIPGGTTIFVPVGRRGRRAESRLPSIPRASRAGQDLHQDTLVASTG
jgi:hypothetical protein